MLLGYLAVSQYGTKLMLTEPKHPRKQLLAKLGASNCRKQYSELKSGDKHTGYIVGAEWFTIYEVHSWEGKA
jgi:hypothetical protein